MSKFKSNYKETKHPYTRPDFWLNPTNQFWNNPNFTEKAKEYFQEFVNNLK